MASNSALIKALLLKQLKVKLIKYKGEEREWYSELSSLAQYTKTKVLKDAKMLQRYDNPYKQPIPYLSHVVYNVIHSRCRNINAER